MVVVVVAVMVVVGVVVMKAIVRTVRRTAGAVAPLEELLVIAVTQAAVTQAAGAKRSVKPALQLPELRLVSSPMACPLN